MLKIPLIRSSDLSFEFIVKTFALIKVFFNCSFFEVLIIEVVDLSLLLLNKVLHSMKILDVPDI